MQGGIQVSLFGSPGVGEEGSDSLRENASFRDNSSERHLPAIQTQPSHLSFPLLAFGIWWAMASLFPGCSGSRPVALTWDYLVGHFFLLQRGSQVRELAEPGRRQ